MTIHEQGQGWKAPAAPTALELERIRSNASRFLPESMKAAPELLSVHAVRCLNCNPIGIAGVILTVLSNNGDATAEMVVAELERGFADVELER